MQHFFLESPWLLIPTLVVLQLILIKVWSNRRTKGAKNAMLVGFLLLLALPIIQKFVVTPREQVRQTIEELVAACDEGDIDRVGRLVSPRFEIGRYDRDEFLDSVERTLTRIKIESPHITHLETTVSGDTAETDLAVEATLVMPDSMTVRQLSSWTVTFELEGDAWKMVSVKPRHTPLFPFDNMNELLR